MNITVSIARNYNAYFYNNLKAKSKYEKTPKNDVTGNACAIISCGEVAGNDR
jgi:hypothetical protein